MKKRIISIIMIISILFSLVNVSNASTTSSTATRANWSLNYTNTAYGNSTSSTRSLYYTKNGTNNYKYKVTERSGSDSNNTISFQLLNGGFISTIGPYQASTWQYTGNVSLTSDDAVFRIDLLYHYGSTSVNKGTIERV